MSLLFLKLFSLFINLTTLNTYTRKSERALSMFDVDVETKSLGLLHNVYLLEQCLSVAIRAYNRHSFTMLLSDKTCPIDRNIALFFSLDICFYFHFL